MTGKDDKHQAPKSKVQDKNTKVQASDELNDEALEKVSGGGAPFGFKPNAPGKNPGARGRR